MAPIRESSAIPCFALVCALVTCAAALSACGDRAPSTPGAAVQTQLAEAPASSAQRQAMVREHVVDLEVPSDAIEATVDRLIATCSARPNGECLLVSTRRAGGDYPSGEVQMRLAPVAVPPTMSVVTSLGRVTAQTSSATDVSESLADTAAKLKTLELYRAQLEKLQASARDVDALIKIANEIARTQTEIDGLTTERASTMARTRTERLNVTVHSPYAATGNRAIGTALQSFGGNVLAVIAAMITVLSGVLPIGVVFVVAWLLWRAWRRRK